LDVGGELRVQGERRPIRLVNPLAGLTLKEAQPSLEGDESVDDATVEVGRAREDEGDLPQGRAVSVEDRLKRSRVQGVEG
jgi:hypothetical protein